MIFPFNREFQQVDKSEIAAPEYIYDTGYVQLFFEIWSSHAQESGVFEGQVREKWLCRSVVF